MTNPKRVTEQLRNIRDWNHMLPPAALATYSTTSHIRTVIHTTGASRDLSTLIAHTIDAEDEGAHAIRTPAHITRWATTWATLADLHYTGNPLNALADNTTRLAQTFTDWDALADDTAILHTRIATLTGHAPRTIGPCTEPGCAETVTQAQTSHGAEGPLECPRGHTYPNTDTYMNAVRAADQHILQTITDPTIRVTISQFLKIWPTLTKDDIRNWTRTHRLTLTNTHPQTLNLATANQLAQTLTTKRQHKAPPPRKRQERSKLEAGRRLAAQVGARPAPGPVGKPPVDRFLAPPAHLA